MTGKPSDSLFRFASALLLLQLALPTVTPAADLPDETPENFKIAFIGDQGLGASAKAVLWMIKSEGAHAVVHAGDFDYADKPREWEKQINGILGPDFPYLSVIGNHDRRKWRGPDGYQQWIERRFNRLGIAWEGDLGVQCRFRYKGILFVFVAPGEIGSDHDDYIRESLRNNRAIWRICAWHKNMRPMQLGGSLNATGWGVYREARRGGAIIVTGHDHTYGRTHLLESIRHRKVASESDTLRVTEGRTFVVVSGLGGRSIHKRKQFPLGNWWKGIHTADRGADYGALFGVFNVDGRSNRADFTFKDITGKVVDRFTVIRPLEEGR